MDGERTKRSWGMWLVVGVAVVVGALVGGLVMVSVRSDSSASALVLESADQPGADPFTDSAQADGVPAVQQAAIDKASAVRDQLPRDTETAVLVASGSTPGLYGGTGDAKVCDAAKLVDYLNGHPDKAAAFAGVLGITTEGIADYVASLTPVLLVHDTVVTNHGFSNGKATSVRSVLQAGTAVMVDAQGVPRVKCNCGNPLTPPEVVTTADWKLKGDPWAGFDPTRVTGVVAGDTVTQFVVINVTTGATYTQNVGSAAADASLPSIDGAWTLRLGAKFNPTSPLPDGEARDPRFCPTASLDGAVMTIRGTDVTVAGTTGFGADLVGTVGGAPLGTSAALQQIQQSLGGVVITLHPADSDDPVVRLNLATSPTTLAGTVSMTGAQDPTVAVTMCDAGIVGSKGGASSAGSAPSPSTTPTTAPSTPSTTSTTPPSASADGSCDEATLEALMRANSNYPNDTYDVQRCNGRWALVGWYSEDAEGVTLLEWDGSAWTFGACQRYGNPNDITYVPPQVPAEYFIACQVG